MTKDKTLKLALEVNESMKDVLKQVNELIAENKALKEALAQEQEPIYPTPATTKPKEKK